MRRNGAVKTVLQQCGAGRTSRARMVWHTRKRVEGTLALAAGATRVQECPDRACVPSTKQTKNAGLCAVRARF